MIKVRRTPEFQKWFDNLRDKQATARILARIYRAEDGNLGDVKPVGGGVSEMRIAYGPGYRLYFIMEGKLLVVLLCGGDILSGSRHRAGKKNGIDLEGLNHG
jgi:putative addiction module killer protein